MISFFRHHLQGRFLRGVIYAVSLLMVLPYSFTLLLKWFVADDWAVKVNSTAISMQEYNNRVSEVSQQIENLRRMLGPQADRFFAIQGVSAEPEKMAVDALVADAIIHDVAHKMYLSASPDLVRQQVMASLPKQVRRPDGSIDEAMLERYTQRTLAQLEAQRADQVLQDTVTHMSVGAVYVPRFMIKDKFIEQNADKKCIVATIPFKTFVDAQEAKPIDDSRLKSFMDAQNRASKRYMVPEKRAGVVWMFDAQTYGAPVAEKQQREYYNRHKYQEFVEQPARMQVRHIQFAFDNKNRQQQWDKANAVLKELKANPALFEQRAKELSSDGASKSKGGLVEFPAGKDGQFEKAAFKLIKDGDISPVLETPMGFEIIMRVGKKTAVYKPFEKVTQEIEKKLRAQHFERAFNFEAKYAVARLENKAEALAEFARKKNATKKEIVLTATTEDPLVQKLFNGRRDTAVFSVEGTKGYAVIVTELQKTFQPPFESIKARVRQDYVNEQAQNALNGVLVQARMINSVDGLEKFASEHGFKVDAPVWVKKSDKKSLDAFAQHVGQAVMRELSTIAHAPAVVGGISGAQGVVLLVQELTPFDEKAFQAQEATLRGELMREQKTLVEQAFVASLYKNATIKISDKIASRS